MYYKNMNYSFIKEDINSSLQGEMSQQAYLENYLAFRDNNFILKHNINAINDFINFLKTPDNIFILNGFMGAGKTNTANVFTDFVSDDVLVFKCSYLNSINLDDILLSLFKDFSVYHNENKITLPKIESNIFSEKINAYIKNCNAPMLFIFDSFETNTFLKETQKDILDFIQFLSHFEKIKIVICTRSFMPENLKTDTSVVSHSLKPLTKDEVYDYLNIYKITGSKYECEELYKITHGHYLLVELSVLIMHSMHISLGVFGSEFARSTRTFLEFLVSKLFSFTSDKFIKLLILLSTIRHGLSKEFLISHGYTKEEDLNYLLQKHIVEEKFGKYYIKDYIKNEYVKSFSADTKLQVHEYLVKLYDDELPLKPFDRELFLSRQTMRQEIAFHKEKIEKLNEEISKTGKSNKSRMAEMKNFNYFTYSKNSGYDKDEKEDKTKQKRYLQNVKTKPTDNRNKFELSKEDSKLLLTSSNNDQIEKNFKDIVAVQGMEEIYNASLKSTQIETETNEAESLDDFVEIAQTHENNYNFPSAILHYKKALSCTDDKMFKVKEPILYTKLAICYKKVQDYEESVNNYEKAYELYLTESTEKANKVLLSIAQIYSEIYKFDKVKEVYNRILHSSNISSEMTVRCYLGLSEIEDNNLDFDAAFEYAKKAVVSAEKSSNIKLITECYFKYGLLFDDNNDLGMAQKNYLKCIQCSKDVEENLFLSSAYSNLAGISLDNDNIPAAKKYYELAISVDKQTNNYESLYYSYSKLAELYKDTSSEKHYEYLVKALGAAKRFDDTSYAVSIYAQIGNHYLKTRDYKRALKSFILAKNLSSSNSQGNLISKIDTGINGIKTFLGESEFLKILEEIKKKK